MGRGHLHGNKGGGVSRGEGGHAWRGEHEWQEKRALQWTVRILLECILIQTVISPALNNSQEASIL